MSEATNAAIAVAAWLVAGSLAGAGGAGAFAFACCRRARRAEAQLSQLQGAVSDFCDALRARLSLEKSRLGEEGASGAPEAPEVERVA